MLLLYYNYYLDLSVPIYQLGDFTLKHRFLPLLENSESVCTLVHTSPWQHPVSHPLDLRQGLALIGPVRHMFSTIIKYYQKRKTETHKLNVFLSSLPTIMTSDQEGQCEDGSVVNEDGKISI